MDAFTEAKPHPIKWWAGAGVVAIAVQVYAFSRWIASGQATPTDPGPTPIPGWMNVTHFIWQYGGLVAFVCFMWFVVIKPWRRDRRIPFDGLMCLAVMQSYWQNTLLNSFNNWFTWNAAMVNLGAWYDFLPGWIAPNGHLQAEPILWAFPAYAYVLFGGVIVGCALMRKVKEWRPQTSKAGVVASCFITLAIFDLVMEPIFMVMGIFAYPGAIKELTLFHGNFYQFPIYEAVLWSGCWTAWACFRHFKNDKGETLAERGLDRIKVRGAKRTSLRFLALVGAVNVLYLFLYMVPIMIHSLYSDPWPEDITKRSYFMHGLCGPGTDHICSGPDTPIPRRGSSHVGPNGELLPGR